MSSTQVDFRDNSECIALIERGGSPPGLLALLDEECRFPKASDSTFLEKITAQHKEAKNFERPKNARTSFVVKHYAGEVAYEVFMRVCCRCAGACVHVCVVVSTTAAMRRLTCVHEILVRACVLS